jgi:hypothetical protein
MNSSHRVVIAKGISPGVPFLAHHQMRLLRLALEHDHQHRCNYLTGEAMDPYPHPTYRKDHLQ